MPIRAILDHKIRVSHWDLPETAARHIVEALEIPNIAKQEAKKQKIWGWQQMPDKIALWADDGDHLVMPRGFAHDFADGMAAMGIEIDWRDERKYLTTWNAPENLSTPKKWQIPQIDSIIQHEQGILKSPAGSGKTVTVLLTIGELMCKSLIIVNTKDIVWQWQERVRDHLGENFPVGQVGDGVFAVSEFITVATAQTLHRRFDDLEREGFFDDFSFVCLDECHHATAETYNTIMNRFSARYRVGVSATPDKTGDFALATNVLGPVFHTTHPREVDSLMIPVVKKVPTKFGFGFRPTMNRWQRSNYPQMIQALIADKERNELIVEKILANEGHHQLVVSKRLEHLRVIKDMLEEAGFRDPIATIIGADKNDDRQYAVALAADSPCVILSTLADEAMDIPRLDRMHLTYPQRNAGLVTQQVGRVERKHPDKKDAIIYDYADMNVGPLEKQWRTRRFEVYEPRGYKIDTERTSNG